MNSTTLQQNSDAVAGWGEALTEDGDILFYGCNVAGDSNGQVLLNNIAELTGTEVAASDDFTGSAKLGGDWELEYQAGDIESTVAFSAQTQQSWAGLLADNLPPVNTVPGNQTTAEDTDLTFSSGNGNQISISDPDAGSNEVEVTLSVNNGTLSVNAAPQPIGSEVRSNTTTANTQSSAVVATDAAGNYVVVWTDSAQDGAGYGVYAQRYNSAGVAQGSEFLVNTETASNQDEPSVAMDDNGNFVVAWTSYGQDKKDTDGVFAQRFDANGVAQGGEFGVNSTNNGNQSTPLVAMDADGDFVVVWQGAGSGDTVGVFGQRYNAAGVAQGSEFLVNSTTTDEQSTPAVAMDAAGNFVVAWHSLNQDGAGYEIYAQRFNAAGTAQGTEFRVNTTTASDQNYPSIAMNDAGSFVVAWQSYDQDGSLYGIYGRVYDAAGTPQTGEIQVNQTTSNHQTSPAVGIDATGNFVVAWQHTNYMSYTDIYARSYDATGTPQADEFAATTNTISFQSNPAVSVSSSGDFVVAWQGSGTGDSSGVHLRRYQVPASALTFTTGDGADDATMTLNGTIADINAVLDGLTYTPNPGYNGIDTLLIVTNDQGNSGSAGALVDCDPVDITVGTVANAPAIDLDVDDSSGATGTGFAASWTEDGGAVVIVDGDATLTDGDENLTQLTVTILNRLDGTAEVLSGNAGATGLSVNYDSGTGVLTISGTGTAAQYQQVLRTVTYDNTSDNPNTTPRVIAFTPSDAVSDGNTATTTLAIANANDAPVNTAPASWSTSQDFPIVFSTVNGNQIAISDPDAGSNEVKVTLTVTNGTLTLYPQLPVGSEVSINETTTGTQNDVHMATAADGSYIVTWTSVDADGAGVWARRYDVDGNPLDSEFQVNATATGNQIGGRVAMADDGSFTIVWLDDSQDGSGWGVFGQRFDVNGNTIDGEFQINTATASNQLDASIAMDANGDFVVVWSSYASPVGVFGQHFDADGNEVGTEFRVSPDNGFGIDDPVVAMNSGGAFVVAWESTGQDGDLEGIFVQVYDASGNPVGSAVQANTYTTNRQQVPAVAIDDAGNFVVAWESWIQDGSDYGVFARSFDATGAPQGGEIQVNTTTADTQGGSSVAIDSSSGEFVVAWQSVGPDGSGYGICSQRFDASGAAVGAETLVNTTTNNSQTNPYIAMDNSGNFVVAWEGEVDGDTSGVSVQRFLSPTSAFTFSTGDGTDDDTMTFTGKIADINAALEGLTYTPNGGYNGVDTLTIITDDLGNTGTGGALQDSDQVSITVGNPNAPVIDLDANDSSGQTAADFAATWTEGSGAVAIVDTDGTLIDSDENLTSLAVTITNLLDGAAEILTANAGATGLSVNYDSGTGVLTISGAGTAAQYQQVLRTVTYNNTSDMPDITARIVTFTATDAISNGSTATTTLTVVATNDAPIHTVPGSQNTAVDTDLVFSSADGNPISISDPDAGSNEVEVTLTVTNGTLTLPATVGGSETLVNTTTANTQSHADIAYAGDGSFVVTWVDSALDGSGSGIFMQRFDAAGAPVGDEVQVNTYATSNQTNPAIAMDDSGNFVIVWESYQQDGDTSYNTYAQRFDNNGNTVGGEILVNSSTAGAQYQPDIVMNSASGDFTVIWYGNSDGGDVGVFMKQFSFAGAVLIDETLVSNAANIGSEPSIAMNDAGNFVIAWKASDADREGIYAQRFDASGNSVGGILSINATKTERQELPQVALDASGNFIVVWQSLYQEGVVDGMNGIYAQRFDNTGLAQGLEFKVNDITLYSQSLAAIDVDQNGDFIITWQSLSGDGSGRGVYAKKYDSDGNILTNDFLVNTTTVNGQESPAVAFGTDGSCTIVWQGEGVGDSSGVFLKTFTTVPLGFSIGDGTDDTTMTFTGTIDDINTALDGLTFTPTASFNGTATVTITTDDQGNTGTGGALSDVDIVNITVGTANETPTTSGISNVTVDEDAADTVIDLFAAFADSEDADSALTYTITNNTNAGLFTSTAIDAVAGTLTLDYAADQNGTADITVRATDTGGEWIESSFTVTVNAVNDAPSFTAGTGTATTPIGTGADRSFATVVQPDGKVLVAGTTLNGGSYDFVVARYNADGTLDTGFGTDGKVLTPVGTLTDEAHSIALQDDGKIVVAGYASSGDNDFAVVRYNADGSLDTGFGTGGKVTTPIGSGDDYAHDVTVQADGKIIVSGYTKVSLFDTDFALVRYNADGSLDTGFGTGGKVTTAFGTGYDEAYGVTVQSDGKIIVAGSAINGSEDFALVRYNADGSLDTGFGTGGKVTTPIGTGTDTAYDVLVQADGKIVVAGEASGTGYDFALARYNADGSLDTGFGSGGTVLTAVSANNDFGRFVALQSDGKIVVGGSSNHDDFDYDFALIRVTTPTAAWTPVLVAAALPSRRSAARTNMQWLAR